MKEPPMYRTTKDVHYPLSSFNNAQIRITNESQQINNLHDKLKGMNYKIGDKGQQVALMTQQRLVHDTKMRADNSVIPQRFNQEETTGITNQNLQKNLSIGQDVASLRG